MSKFIGAKEELEAFLDARRQRVVGKLSDEEQRTLATFLRDIQEEHDNFDKVIEFVETLMEQEYNAGLEAEHRCA